MDKPSDLPASNHYASNDSALLNGEYFYLWPQVQISEQWQEEVASFAKQAIANQSKYQAVSDVIGCPWWFVACIHYREASMNWSSNIANGDPWNEVTVHVPEGRGPFDSWSAAAIDALKYEGYAGLSDWSFGMSVWRLEGYNGWGYRINGQHTFQCHKEGNRVGTFDGVYQGSMQDTTPRNASPYIYNGTQFYQSGVSIEDHSFYPNAIDDQPGCMILIKALEGAGVTIL